VASWLYKVAYRVALRARDGTARRARRERHGLELAADGPARDPPGDDLRPVLDEEVNRLPEKYRRAVVLCYLAGKSTAEAARQLGCARGTVLSRLAWARQRLRERLTRRGVALSAGALAAALAEGAAAAVPGPLVASTTKAAMGFAAGPAAAGTVASARAVSLMEGVLRAMFMTRVKVVAAVAAAALLGASVVLWSNRPLTAEPIDRSKEGASRAAAGDAEASRARGREVQRPVGTWERDVGPFHITIRIEADRLYGTFSGADKDCKITVELDADYSVNKDGVLFGVITGLDLSAGSQKEELGDVAALNNAFADQPFSFRFRVDGDFLTVKDLKFAGDKKECDPKDLLIIQGRYKNKSAARK
jgi:hypothetical protein